MLARHPEVAAERENGWEVGRLVLAAEYRAQPDILRSCLDMVLRRFIEDHPEANFFASCNALLARLYRRYGLSMLLKDACVQDGEQYSVIHGNVRSVQLAVGREVAA